MKSTRTVLCVGLGLLLSAGLAFWAVPHWRRGVIERQDRQARERVASLLAAGQGGDARTIIRLQPRPFRHPDWSAFEVRALAITRDVVALDALSRREPEALQRDEDATLLLLRAWLARRSSSSYERLRAAWRGNERAKGRWRLLDVDALLRAGKRDAAAELLRSETLIGADEAGRLLRLALLAAPQDQKTAWWSLSQARLTDPQNPEIRSFCAQFLEAAGCPAEARVEYVAAALADSSNPLWWDQLAEYYRRQGTLDLAIQTWGQALLCAPLDVLWLKTLFWGRVVQPGTTVLPAAPPDGALAELVAVMQATPTEAFWDAAARPGTRVPSNAAREHPEVFWLTVLEELRAGREAEAQRWLAEEPVRARELQPDLGAALQQILALRGKGALPSTWGSRPAPSTAPPRHTFFDELQPLRRSRDLTPLQASFLNGPHAFAAACLAAGWRGAALSLWAERPLPQDVPEWYVYALAQAVRYNRGPEAALALLKTRPPTPLLELLTAELLIAQQHLDEGCARLESLVPRADALGDRAAWLMATTRLEQGRPDDVRAVLARQPRLSAGVAGREIAARLELAEGHTDQAETLYRALATESNEARVWLSRRAVQRGDWDEARRLTVELIAALPGEMDLRRSLAAIEAEVLKK
jgi:predicted Zn-dependent protease